LRYVILYHGLARLLRTRLRRMFGESTLLGFGDESYNGTSFSI